ncbi:YejG family protein [Erwinia sp. SLM-02]|uniref:YejG family protein n=1 Tax=Erwinia sp. SLM-02 TaxID=3020057 RepID=UPI0028D697E7|nr:YejG family protein [uncultured Erwinia sp.]
MLNTLQHSVVHRLPASYRRCSGPVGVTVEPQASNVLNSDDDLIGLRLLSHNGDSAWEIMQNIKLALADMQLDCAVLELEGEPCLFVHRQDECTTTCRLKNFGVGIAETFAGERHD